MNSLEIMNGDCLAGSPRLALFSCKYSVYIRIIRQNITLGQKWHLLHQNIRLKLLHHIIFPFLCLSPVLLQDSWGISFATVQNRISYRIYYSHQIPHISCDHDISRITFMSSGMLTFWYRSYNIYSTYHVMDYIPRISWILGISFDPYKSYDVSSVLVQNIWGFGTHHIQISLKSLTFPNMLSYHMTSWFPTILYYTILDISNICRVMNYTPQLIIPTIFSNVVYVIFLIPS